MSKQWRRMLPVTVFVIFIFAVASIPRFAPPGPEFWLRDKVAHFIEFLILGILLFRAVGWQVSASRWVTFGFLTSVGATIGAVNEVYQTFIPGREMSLGDWLADLAGVAVGIGLYAFTSFGVSSSVPPARERSLREEGQA
jgi:VanZ family protein